MRHLIMTGVSVKTFRSDKLGIGFNWGGPNDRSRRDQFAIEVYYGFQLTEHVNVAPDVQLTINPSFNDEKDHVVVFSTCRVRLAL